MLDPTPNPQLQQVGGVQVTIKPHSTSASALTHSLTNLHGDLMANIDADGQVAYTPITGPFGEKIPSLNGAQQINTTHLGPAGSSSYLGSYRKTTDSGFATRPTQMGARVYIAELGRFLSVDPIEGGTLNNYVYAMDPVNQVDVSGKAVPILSVAWMIVKATLSAGARVFIPAALGVGPIRGHIRFPRVPFRSIPRPSPLPGRHFAIPNHAQRMIGRIRANNFSPPPGVSSKPYQNNPQKFGTGEKPPDFDRLGQPIKYREYDVHPLKPGVNRGRERIVVGNDSSIYYTNDHYETFTIVEQGGIVNKATMVIDDSINTWSTVLLDTKMELLYGRDIPSRVREYLANNIHKNVADGLSWRSDAARIKQRQDELFYQTLRFDLENTPEYWPRVFGDRPLEFEARVEKAFAYIQQLPPLIPIGGLKFYVPTVTSDMNQPLPVISFHQFVDSILWSQDINSYEKGVPGDLSQVPEITGWCDVLDGLGADEGALYI